MSRRKEMATRRLSMNIALLPKDNVLWKVYANTPVAAAILDCIDELKKEVPERG